MFRPSSVHDLNIAGAILYCATLSIEFSSLSVCVPGEKRRNDRAGDEPDGMGSSKRQGRTVRASHLLVKHRDSRRPASWKEPQGSTRTQEEALASIQVGLG